MNAILLIFIISHYLISCAFNELILKTFKKDFAFQIDSTKKKVFLFFCEDNNNSLNIVKSTCDFSIDDGQIANCVYNTEFSNLNSVVIKRKNSNSILLFINILLTDKQIKEYSFISSTYTNYNYPYQNIENNPLYINNNIYINYNGSVNLVFFNNQISISLNYNTYTPTTTFLFELSKIKIHEFQNNYLLLLNFLNNDDLYFNIINSNTGSLYKKKLNLPSCNMDNSSYDYLLVNGQNTLVLVCKNTSFFILKKLSFLFNEGNTGNEIVFFNETKYNLVNTPSSNFDKFKLTYLDYLIVLESIFYINRSPINSFLYYYIGYDSMNNLEYKYFSTYTFNTKNIIISQLILTQNIRFNKLESYYIIGYDENNLYKLKFVKLDNSQETLKADNFYTQNINDYEVSSCEANEYIIHNTGSFPRCISCKNGYLFKNSCISDVSKCPSENDVLLKRYCKSTSLETSNKYLSYFFDYSNKKMSCSNSNQVLVNNECYACSYFGKVKFLERCVDRCPLGYVADSSSVCQLACSVGFIYNIFTNRCISCNGYLDLFTNACVSTCSQTQTVTVSYNLYCGCNFETHDLIYNPPSSSCVTKNSCTPVNLTSGLKICSSLLDKLAINGLCEKNYEKNSNNICVEKKCNITQFLYENNCISQCPDRHKIVFNPNSTTNMCVSCNSTDYYYENNCFLSCPTSTFTLTETRNCSLSCPQRYEEYVDFTISYRECRKCSPTQFIYNKKCYNECPIGTFPNTNDYTCIKGCHPSIPNCHPTCELKSSFFNRTSLVCEKCKSYLPFVDIENGTCLEKCNIKSYSDELNNCINCNKSQFLDLSSSKCVDSCPSNSTAENELGVCQNCLGDKMRFDPSLGRCLKGCSNSNYLWNDDVGCFLMTKVILNKTIIDECPPNMEVSIMKVCEECSGYILNGKCVSRCDLNYFPNQKKECLKCGDMNKFQLNDSCLDDCPSGYVKNDITHRCTLSNKETIKNRTVSKEKDPNCECVHGECIKNSTDCSKCTCDNGFTGKYCELDNSQFEENRIYFESLIKSLPSLTDISNLNSNYNKNGLSSEQKANIYYIGRVIKKIPLLFNENTLNLIKEITRDNFIRLLSNRTYDKLIYNFASSTMMIMKIKECNSPNRLLQEVNIQSMSSLKRIIDNSFSSFIRNENLNLTLLSDPLSNSSLIQSDTFSTYVLINNEDGYKQAKRLQIPYVNYTKCEKYLKTINLLPKNDTLFLLINIWKDDENTIKQTSLSNRLINSKGDEIDTTKCGRVEIKFPIRDTNLLKNLTKYKEILDKYGADIFNNQDSFFFELCIRYIEQENDITLGKRQEMYNMSIVCSNDCQYEGVDEDGYSICSCDANNIDDVVNTLKDSFISGFTKTNIKVVTCFQLAFSNEIFTNLGFWLITILTLVFIFSISIYSLFYSRRLIDKYISDVIHVDAVFKKEEKEEPAPVGVRNDSDQVKGKNRVTYLPEDNKVKEKDKVEVDSAKNILKQEGRVKFSSIDLNNPTSKINQRKDEVNNISEYIIDNTPSNNEFQSKSNMIYLHNFNSSSSSKNRNLTVSKPSSHKDLTLKDFQSLTIEEQLLIDKRSFFRFLYDRLLMYHSILILFKKSIIESFTIRALDLMYNYSFQLCFNAIFFSDSYIDKRTNQSLIQNNTNGFLFTFLNEFSKSLFSTMIATGISFLSGFIISVPEKVEEEFNEYLIRRDKEQIKIGYEQFKKRMRLRNYIWIIYMSLLHLFSWYYVLCFCSVYINSSYGWLYGSLISILMDILIFEVIYHLILSIFRYICQKKPNKITYLIYRYISKLIGILV